MCPMLEKGGKKQVGKRKKKRKRNPGKQTNDSLLAYNPQEFRQGRLHSEQTEEHDNWLQR